MLSNSKKQQKINVEANLSNVIDLITQITDETISDQIERINNTDNLLKTIEISELINDLDINFYCSKTGRKLGQWSIDDLRRLQLAVGNDRAKYIIIKKQFENVAIDWIYTDTKALENLSNSDPIGYFVYATNYVIPIIIDLPQITEDKQIKYIYERNIEKAIIAKQLQEIDLNIIVATNELMRRYLSLIQTKKAIRVITKYCKKIKFTEYTLTNIATTNWSVTLYQKALKKILNEIIREEYRRNRIKTDLTYADVVNLKLRYEGYANFRSQRRLRNMTEIEHVMMELQEFIPANIVERMHMEQVKEQSKQTGVKAIKVDKPVTIKIAKPSKKPFKISFASALRRQK